MRKKLLSLTCVVTLLIFTCTNAFATTSYSYNEGTFNVTFANDSGFWCRATLPTLDPKWKSGVANKINFEFWYNINGGFAHRDWVEMGYHTGWSYNSDGTPNLNASYNGCFTARYIGGSVWSTNMHSSLNWAPGQSHTMGNLFTYSSTQQKWLCDMRTDNSVIVTFSDTAPGDGYIDAGYEWTVSDGSAQTTSLPSAITDLNVYRWQDSGGQLWKTWASYGGVTESNSHSGVTCTWDPTNNKLNFN